MHETIRGAGRFEQIGIPNLEFFEYFFGREETFDGALILPRRLARLGAVPSSVMMIVAIIVTKNPVLLGHGPELPRNVSAGQPRKNTDRVANTQDRDPD